MWTIRTFGGDGTMSKHAGTGGVAGSYTIGGDVGFAGGHEVESRVLGRPLVVLSQPEPGDLACRVARHREQREREREQPREEHG